MNIAEQRIATKIAAREQSFWVFEMIKDEWEDGTGAQYAEAFLDEMRKLLPCKKEDEPKTPTKPLPIARLGKYLLWYQGRLKSLDDIPMAWLHSQVAYREKDREATIKYLDHPDIIARRGSE